jgi:hypothetical protein
MENEKRVNNPKPPNEIETLSALLKQNEIKTLADLKRCIAVNADHGVVRVADHAQASKTLLVALLIADMGNDPSRNDDKDLLYYWRGLKTRARRRWPQLRRNWPDLLALVMLPLVLISLGYRAYSINKTLMPYVRVKSGSGLPIFHKVDDEIEIDRKPGSASGLTALEQARNRYTLVPVGAGSPLKEGALLSADLSNKMKDRIIFSVPLGGAGQSYGLPIPGEAILVLSPKTFDATEKGSVSFEVIVLRIDKKGDSNIATVALRSDQFDPAARLLASRDAYLAQSLR